MLTHYLISRLIIIAWCHIFVCLISCLFIVWYHAYSWSDLMPTHCLMSWWYLCFDIMMSCADYDWSNEWYWPWLIWYLVDFDCSGEFWWLLLIWGVWWLWLIWWVLMTMIDLRSFMTMIDLMSLVDCDWSDEFCWLWLIWWV